MARRLPKPSPVDFWGRRRENTFVEILTYSAKFPGRLDSEVIVRHTAALSAPHQFDRPSARPDWATSFPSSELAGQKQGLSPEQVRVQRDHAVLAGRAPLAPAHLL